MRRAVLSLVGVLLLAGCSDPQTGPLEPHWDRDACERCRMVLSDRTYAAQIRYLPQGKKRPLTLWFDDFGCASLWLDEQSWRNNPGIEIWVTDYQSGKWVDARIASYVVGKVTPMAYGLGASPNPVEGGLDYVQVKQHIRDVEQRFNIRQAHLLEQAKNHAAEAPVLPPIEKKGGN